MIGNGDVVDIASAKKMFATGVDAVMIGRGCLGNPWLIRDLVAYFERGEVLPSPSYLERIEMCFHHLDYLLRIKCEKVAVLEMRSHIAWYVKGLPDSVEVKNACFQETTAEGLRKILKNYLNKLES